MLLLPLLLLLWLPAVPEPLAQGRQPAAAAAAAAAALVGHQRQLPADVAQPEQPALAAGLLLRVLLWVPQLARVPLLLGQWRQQQGQQPCARQARVRGLQEQTAHEGCLSCNMWSRHVLT